MGVGRAGASLEKMNREAAKQKRREEKQRRKELHKLLNQGEHHDESNA